MKLSKKEVEHIAQLARLRLPDKELEKYSDQLSSILGYVEQLQELNVEGVLETSQVTGRENSLREDVVENIDEKTRKIILDNMPEKDDDLLKTKAVF